MYQIAYVIKDYIIKNYSIKDYIIKNYSNIVGSIILKPSVTYLWNSG